MKDIIRYVILGILFVAIVVLGIMLVFKNNNDGFTKYQFYDDDLIEIDNQTSMQVQANITNSESLGVLVSSDLDEFFLVKIEVTYYDDSHDKVSTQTNELTVFDHGTQFAIFFLPDLYDGDAGTIDIKVTGEKTDKGAITSSQIEMTETHSVDDTLSTNFTVQVTNNSDVNIPGLVGQVVLLKEDKIVGYQTFDVNELMAHSTLSSDIVFVPNMKGSQSLAVDFDKAIFFPVHIFDEKIG